MTTAAQQRPGRGRRALAALVVGAVLALPGAARAAPGVDGVAAVGMTVADVARSRAFFTEVLGFEPVSEHEVAGPDYDRLQGVFALRMRVARLRLGDEILELTEYLAPRGRPLPPDARSNDRSFQHVAIVVRDMDRAYARLRRHGVTHASPEPQTLPAWNRAAGGIRAFYFKDPDGHALELLQFPPDKGDPRWHRPGDALFLGIDHTAIVVGDTDASLRLYRDVLGLRVAGSGENSGTEQERLNAVFGARLRITALRGARGPGIELLEYLSPRDGRPAPPDLRANDLAHWQTRLPTADLVAMAAAVQGAGATLVSPGAVTLPDATLGFTRGVAVRDPDGHGMLLVAP